MRDSGNDGLGEALAAAEAAPPVESVDVIAAALRRQLGARSVSFLITDFTGGSVVRLGAADDIDLDRPADAISVSGTVYEQVIRTQQPHVERIGAGPWSRVIAPVTNRGDAIGLLELYLPDHCGANSGPGADPSRAQGQCRHHRRSPAGRRLQPAGRRQDAGGRPACGP